MDVVMIFNGLGNQMSQYAFYLAKKRRNPNVKYWCLDNDHNGYELDRIFGIPKHGRFQAVISFIKKLAFYNKRNPIILSLRRILTLLSIDLIVESTDYKYNDKLLINSNKHCAFYLGGWHNYRYFENLNLKEVFAFNIHKLNETSTQYLNSIKESESVAVHIRRGDYLSPANKAYFGGIASDDYYRHAIDFIQQESADSHFFIFTNDSEWVAENLKLQKMTIVSGNAGGDSWMDMFLMSRCKHIIIANSTFSWWAAYLSSAKTIICPPRFNYQLESAKIYPQNWIKIS